MARSPRGRLGLFVAYWAFGLVVWAPTRSLGARLPAGAARELALLAIKLVLSLLVPALFIGAVRPERPWPAIVGAVPEGEAPRRPARAVVVAALFFALLYGAAWWQMGQAPSLAPASLFAALLGFGHVAVEELASRGVHLRWLAEERPFWRANLWTTAMLLSMHLQGWWRAGLRVEMVPMALVLAMLSLVLGWVTRLSGTVWLAIALHLANNAMSGW